VGSPVQPLLLDIPEVIETDRLRLRATRAGTAGELADACMYAHVF
jgi:hypothetical protein